ncbi:MAG: TetR/AcrR family transcriptional regulator [Myxococcaceae bacterium]|nr:TetR/AcrR family transcriptional regulator [Myxococcaceae bacterium]MCA3016672.1 TetR/AcrR family transcriptional regulator [Myxococcaceae bacterium]
MARPADPHARSALVASARQQFRAHGIQRARIEDITAACGLSKGAFYLHYDSKEALFAGLVTQFEGQLDALFTTRIGEEDAFFARGGPFRAKDLAPRSARMAALTEMQARHDIAALELMWTWRDVIHVLINGCQGTAFDGVIWQAIDREQQRVIEACARLKRANVMRRDISNDVLATMFIGVWVLTMRKMVAQEQKPDFPALIAELNLLVGEGITPRVRAPTRARATPSPLRLSLPHRRAPQRLSSRKSP